MKDTNRGLIIAVFIVFLGILINPAITSSLDYPHSDANTISCPSCHIIHGSAPWSTTPQNIDDTEFNNLCWSCHNGVIAPLEKTHSSLSTDNTYGEWSVECRACHEPHYQDQTKAYGSQSYLYNAASTSVTTSTITKAGAGWTDNQWAGMLVIGNVASSAPVYYKISSNTIDTITVEGTIDTTQVHPGDTFAIVYGKSIKSVVNTKNLKFFRSSGLNSFADGAIPDFYGICQVCHTKTKYYRNDGTGDLHNPDTKCTGCHLHSEGFKPSCDACHGNPPVDASTLVHNPPEGTGSATAGAHDLHVTTNEIGCASCHFNSAGSGPTHNNELTPKRVTMGFSLFEGTYLGGRYDGQTTVNYNTSELNTTVANTGAKECSNIYCHGSTMRDNDGTDTTPVWDNPATGACGTCHGASADNPPLLGSHFKHTSQYFDQLNWGYSYECGLCHNDPGVDKSKHVNNKSELVFSWNPRTAGGTYTGTDAMLDAYGTCTNVYCHSTVQTSPPGGAPIYRVTPVWGTTYSMGMGCDSCHYYNDSTPQLTTGSHRKHFEYLYWGLGPGAECVTCHNYKQADESYSCGCCHEVPGVPYVWSPAADWGHVDHAVEVRFGPLYGGPTLRGNYSGTPEPNDAYGRCSNIYCHSNGTGGTSQTGETRGIADNITPDWGSGPITCSACHGNPPIYPNGSPKTNSHAEHAAANITCDRCHYNTTHDNTTIYSRYSHANRRYDVNRNTTVPGLTFTYTYYATGGRCSTVSCHTGTASCAGATSYWGTNSCP